MTEYEPKLAELAELGFDASEKCVELAEQFVTWFTETLPSVMQWLVENIPALIQWCVQLSEQHAWLDLCPNRRVVHLARHGRKARTRKKNLRRAYKLIDKEAKK